MDYFLIGRVNPCNGLTIKMDIRDSATLLEGITYYASRIADSFTLKAAIATIPIAFTSELLGNWKLLELWFLLNVIDLILGIIIAIKEKKFDRRRLYGWVTKTLTHVLTIILVGIMTQGLYIATGHIVPILDWFIFVLLLTEVTSVLDSFIKLGAPVHPVAKDIVEQLRRRSAKQIKNLGDSENDEEDYEDRDRGSG